MSPFAGHHKILEGFTRAWRGFAFFVRRRKRSGIAGIAQCHRSNGIPLSGNVEDGASFLGIETRHLMD